MLKGSDELRDDRGGPIRPYFDRKLEHNQKAYQGLVRRLQAAGLVGFTQNPLSHVGLFFVWKSGRQKQRLIIDARPANRLFKD
eukprot:101238-Prorocentrum_lima.AAC.1